MLAGLPGCLTGHPTLMGMGKRSLATPQPPPRPWGWGLHLLEGGLAPFHHIWQSGDGGHSSAHSQWSPNFYSPEC